MPSQFECKQVKDLLDFFCLFVPAKWPLLFIGFAINLFKSTAASEN